MTAPWRIEYPKAQRCNQFLNATAVPSGWFDFFVAVTAVPTKIEGAQVDDAVEFQAPGVVEVELLQAFAGREPGGADPALAAMGFSRRNLALQAGDEELKVETVIQALVGSRTGRVVPGANGLAPYQRCEPVSLAEAVGSCYLAGR